MICAGCKEEVFRSKFHTDSKKWFCNPCYPGEGKIATVPGAMFPYSTTNLTGKPVMVQSLRHLRKLEAQSGVHSVAFNQNSNHFDCPPRER